MSALISVLIPAYNAASSIKDAILSCLNQSFQNFELIILDNGSNDLTKEIVKSYTDKRIKLIESEENKGIAPARNTLLKAAQSPYIAWLDADDRMLPERLKIQLDYLEKNTGIDLIGSWITTDSKEIPFKKMPLNHSEISQYLWFKNCMIQPAIMSRNFYTQEGIYYDESYGNSVEDYELWYRLRHLKKFANVPHFLTHYHVSTGHELKSKKAFNHFTANIDRLWEKKWSDIGISGYENEKKTFVSFLYENQTLDRKTSSSIQSILQLLKSKEEDSFFQLMICYHSLRLWRNMSVSQKMTQPGLLANLMHWSQFKRHYLLGY